MGAGANPAGGGDGAAKFNDNSPVSNKEQPQQSKTFDYDYASNDQKKKKQSAEPCELDENVKDGKIESIYKIKSGSNSGSPTSRTGSGFSKIK